MKGKIFPYISPSTTTGSNTTHNKMNVQFIGKKVVKFLQNLLQSHYPQGILTEFARMDEYAIRWSKKRLQEMDEYAIRKNKGLKKEMQVGGVDLNSKFCDECAIHKEKSEFNSVGNGRW